MGPSLLPLVLAVATLAPPQDAADAEPPDTGATDPDAADPTASDPDTAPPTEQDGAAEAVTEPVSPPHDDPEPAKIDAEPEPIAEPAQTKRLAAKPSPSKPAPGEPPKVFQPLRLGEDALVLGGYIQPGFIGVADTEFNQDDQEGFDFANARLTGRGKKVVYERLWVGFKFNFDVNLGNFSVRDVYGSIGWRDDLVRFDIGQLKQPFGLALLQSQSDMQFALSPRIRDIAFGRDQGFQISSAGTVGKRVWMRGAFMMANGEGGFRQRRNLDDKFQYTARYEIGPLGEVRITEPDLDKSKPKFVLAANVGHTESLGKGLGLDDVGARETRVGGDARLHFRGLSVRGEYLHGLRGDNGGEPGFQRWAFTGQAGYVLPIPIALPKFEVVFRYTQLDIDTSAEGDEGTDYVVDNTEVRFIEPGLSIYLFGHSAKLHLSYMLTDLLEGPRVDTNGDPLIGDTFFAFFQFGWL